MQTQQYITRFPTVISREKSLQPMRSPSRVRDKDLDHITGKKTVKCSERIGKTLKISGSGHTRRRQDGWWTRRVKAFVLQWDEIDKDED